MKVEDLEWHDGNIHKIELCLDANKQPEIVIYADLYEDSALSKDRSRVKIMCFGVSGFICTADIEEIKDNSKAGSIQMGYIKSGKLCIHLFGGLIEIAASAFEGGLC